MVQNRLIGIIFAAGRGSRLAPLTDTTPKPLLQVQNKTLINWNLEKIAPFVDSIIIVVNYLGEQIIDNTGNNFQNKPVQYVFQNSPKGGTLGALRTALYSDYLKDINADYLILNSDDIHDNYIYDEFRLNITKNPDQALIAAKVETNKEVLKSFGVLEVDSEMNFQRVWEKPNQFISEYINIGLYYFPSIVREFVSSSFDTNLGREELITEDLFNIYAQNYPIKIVPTEGIWLAVNSLEDLQKARTRLK